MGGRWKWQREAKDRGRGREGKTDGGREEKEVGRERGMEGGEEGGKEGGKERG